MAGTELLLLAEQEPPLASHIVTPRRGYLHHGIYVGAGKVVHYAGLSNGLRRGPVEEISLAEFTRGRPAWVRSNAPSSFDSPEVIRRARSRVGEDCYRLLTNNCEHFCEWCLRAEHRSYQVEAWLVRPARALHTTIRLLARPPSLSGRAQSRLRQRIARVRDELRDRALRLKRPPATAKYGRNDPATYLTPDTGGNFSAGMLTGDPT
jgi:hypothetical protein